MGFRMARNPLDTSNPAITHTPIPIHGGDFQGVSVYTDPSEWPFLSHQTHWATPETNGKPFDETLGLLNPASAHIHFEWAFPYWGEITGPITVPFRMKAFNHRGTFYLDGGPMIRSIAFDPPHVNNFQ